MEKNYYKTKESVEEYIKLAKDLSGGELIKKLKTFLGPNSSLLEIGSGPGTDWNILSKDFKIVGSDNSDAFLDHLRSENPRGRFIKLDALTLETNETFDGIYSNKVLHHLRDNELIDSIQRQYEILNNEGIICHSFWKGKGSEIFKGLFVNYHSDSTLKSFLKDYFEILLIENYTEFEESDSLLLIGKKKGKAD
jgi:SAM-dependent methyltransferase